MQRRSLQACFLIRMITVGDILERCLNEMPSAILRDVVEVKAVCFGLELVTDFLLSACLSFLYWNILQVADDVIQPKLALMPVMFFVYVVYCLEN